MKVSGSGSAQSSHIVKKVRPSRVRSAKTGATFSDALSHASEANENSGAEAVTGSRAPQAVDALLAIQEVEDSTNMPKQTVRWGHEVLDVLEQLRVDLLLGRVPERRLHTVLKLIRTQQGTMPNPELRLVLDDIETRAAVELAKLGKLS